MMDDEIQDENTWKFRFYAMTMDGEFVYGFDNQQQAQEYIRRLNRRMRQKYVRLCYYEMAMQNSAGFTPNYQQAWSEEYVDPIELGITDD